MPPLASSSPPVFLVGCLPRRRSRPTPARLLHPPTSPSPARSTWPPVLPAPAGEALSPPSPASDPTAGSRRSPSTRRRPLLLPALAPEWLVAELLVRFAVLGGAAAASVLPPIHGHGSKVVAFDVSPVEPSQRWPSLAARRSGDQRAFVPLRWDYFRAPDLTALDLRFSGVHGCLCLFRRRAADDALEAASPPASMACRSLTYLVI